MADAKETAEVVEKFPDIMTHEEATRYLRLEPGTPYNIRGITRLKYNLYSREELNHYLEMKLGKKRG